MPTIPLFFEAKQVSTMNVVPQTYAADGTLTAGTAVNLKTAGIFDRFTFNPSRGLFEISAADAQMTNYQPGKDDFEAMIAALDLNGKVNPLITTYATYDIVSIVARGTQVGSGGTAQATLTLFARIASMETTYIEGRNATGLSLKPCGILPAWS